MGEWLVANWGNLASVAGTGLSIHAVVEAGRARAAVRNFQSKQACLNAILQVERAISAAKRMLAATGKKLPLHLCDELRELLNHVRDSRFSSDEEKDHLRLQISQWRVPPARGPASTSALRKLVDDLSLLRNRMLEELEGNL